MKSPLKFTPMFLSHFRHLVWKPGAASALMGVWFAVGLHLLWALLLNLNATPLQVTSVHSLAELFPNPHGLSIVLLSVAGCALYGILKQGGTVMTRVLLLLPQQIVLAISASGAIKAMLVGHFADGVARSHTFLIADQAPAVLALLIHSATILYLALSERWVMKSLAVMPNGV